MMETTFAADDSEKRAGKITNRQFHGQDKKARRFGSRLSRVAWALLPVRLCWGQCIGNLDGVSR
jgi:hypothetical protein